MIILFNPTEKDLHIQYKGSQFSLPANSSGEFSDDVAQYWQGRLHQFLEIQEVEKPKKSTKVTTPAPVDE